MTKITIGGPIRLGACVAATAFALALHAQTHPSRPIRLIVPFPPGGSSDSVARVVVQKFSEGLGQPVVIENRPGVGGLLGSEAVAKAAPDGYMLLVAHGGTMAMNPVVYPNLGYRSQRDFEPVALLTSIPEVLLVNEASRREPCRS